MGRKMDDRWLVSVLILAIGAASLAAGASGPHLVVPRSDAPRLDGILGEADWGAGAQVALDAGGHARYLHDGARLYVAVQGPVAGWSHVYLASGDTVRVLHASAALGSVRYVRSADGTWQTDEAFAYELRDTSLSPAAEEGRARYLAEHGWVASLSGMGEPGAQEYAIDLARLGPEPRIAIVQAGDAAAPTGWPVLTDGTRDPVLVRGDAPTPLSFDLDAWATLELAE